MDTITDPAYIQAFVKAIGITLLLTLLGSMLGLVIAFVVGLCRMSTHRVLRWPAALFAEFFRGSSMLVQMYWLFFVLPFFGLQLAPITAGVLALGLNEGAYASEIVRGTITSRSKGQTEAAIALGMKPTLRMRRILIPQAIPAMLPPFGNVLVDVLKNSSLISLVTVVEMTRWAFNSRINTGDTTALYLTILVAYFILSMLLSWFMAWMEHRFALNRNKLMKFRPFSALTSRGLG